MAGKQIYVHRFCF